MFASLISYSCYLWLIIKLNHKTHECWQYDNKTIDSSITSVCYTLIHIIVRRIHIENIYIVVEYHLFCTRLKNRGKMGGLSRIWHLFWSWKLCSCPHCYQNYWTYYESGRTKEKHGKRNLVWPKIVIVPIMLHLIEKNNNVSKKQCNTSSLKILLHMN